MTQTSYELGQRFISNRFSGAIVWKNTKSIEGVLAWARDRRTGEYVRVYEIGQENEWIQGINEGAWTRGNFETIEAAKEMASRAYRYLNRGLI